MCSVGSQTAFAIQLGPETIAPFSIGYVKGWRRSVCCLIALAGVKLLNIPLDELEPSFKASSHTNLYIRFCQVKKSVQLVFGGGGCRLLFELFMAP